jgi:8-oxo-dGTP pyrophosphatase MutT (NUDIX family)
VAAIAEHDGCFLLVEEEVHGRCVLNQPAGHLEPGETLPEAVRRETREETGWEFEPAALVGVYLYRSPTEGRSYLRFAFCGQARDHDPTRPLDREIRRVGWYARADLQARAAELRSPLVLRCIDDYLAGVRHPLGLLQVVAAQT